MSYVNAVDSIANDNYWKQSLQQSQMMDSVNYANQLAAQQLAAGANTGATGTTGIDGLTFGQGSTTSTTPTTAASEEKKSNAAAWITGGVISAGAAVAFVASRGKTGKGFFENLKAGWKNIWGGNKSKHVFELRNIDNQNIVSLESYQGIRKNIVNEAKKLDISVEAILPESAKIRSTQFTFSTGTGNSRVEWVGNRSIPKNGEAPKFTYRKVSGNNLVEATPTEAEQKAITEIENKINTAITNNKLDVQDVNFYNTLLEANVEGGKAQYITNKCANVLRKKPTSTSTSTELVNVITNRYKIDSQAVNIAAGKNPKLKEAIQQVKAGKVEDYEIISGTWNPQTSTTWFQKLFHKTPKEYKGEMSDRVFDGKFIIENRQIVGAIENGQRVSQARFQELQADYPKFFDDYMSQAKNFEKIVRAIA